jgi:hypothetical protein
LFHDPVLMANHADIASSGLNSLGQIIPLSPISLASTYLLVNEHNDFVAMYDGGKIDRADKVLTSCGGN